MHLSWETKQAQSCATEREPWHCNWILALQLSSRPFLFCKRGKGCRARDFLVFMPHNNPPGAIISPILQVRKLRHTQEIHHPESTRKQWRWDLTLAILNPRLCSLGDSRGIPLKSCKLQHCNLLQEKEKKPSRGKHCLGKDLRSESWSCSAWVGRADLLG